MQDIVMNEKETTKLICGIPHKKVGCYECDEYIWVNVKVTIPICNECLGEIHELQPHASGQPDYHDIMYNGRHDG